MNEVPRSTIDWLLQPSNPSVRWLTLERVLRRSADDPEVVEARAGIMKSVWVRALMREQHPDGWWVNPKNCYQPRGSATVWHLQLLAELGAPGNDPRIVRACDRFLSQNGMPDGGFACGVHRARYSEECLTGHMLYTLAAFGRGMEPTSRAARDWLLDRQLPDGGWNCRPRQSHSSFISTLGAMKAFALMPGREPKSALKRAVEFLLEHRLFFSHTSGKPISKFWPPLIQFPAHYAYDLLHPLRTLALAKAKADRRLGDALDLLEERADVKARWRVDLVPAAMRVEAPGRAAKWATASALGVLHHFGRLSPLNR
jgi:hypothetical protein